MTEDSVETCFKNGVLFFKIVTSAYIQTFCK